MRKRKGFTMGYRLARSYEDQGYKITDIYEDNGKLYTEAITPCWKCGGSGRIQYYAHIEAGICFSCDGAGKFVKHCRVYTDAEREKMDAAAARKKERELEKARAEAAGKIKAWKEKYNISDGHIFIVTGCNTYEIKDILKEQGAKFYSGLGWFFGTETAPAEKDSAYPDGTFLYHTTIDELMYWNDLGGGPYYKEDALANMKKDIANIIKEKNKEKSTSVHIGNIGDRLKKINAIFVSVKYIDSDWGGNFLYTFNIDGNIATWFSQAVIDDSIKPNDKIILSGTVKKHTEYNGILQTQLNRCIVKRGE